MWASDGALAGVGAEAGGEGGRGGGGLLKYEVVAVDRLCRLADEAGETSIVVGSPTQWRR